jgi:surfactin synthase thioesterase subunit
MLHFAGGNRYSFQFINHLLKDFDVMPLELPGRGRRVGEELLKDFDLAAYDLYNQITRCISNAPIIIYGHSMGACLALRVCYLLEQINTNPCCLIVSGNPGPGIKSDKKRYSLGKNDFIEELKLLGGIPSEVIQNEELLNFFLPVLRADFEIVENSNERVSEVLVNAPIYALMGSKEENCEKIFNWRRFTRSSFESKILEGDHFFIRQHTHEIAQIIRNSYHATITPRL